MASLICEFEYLSPERGVLVGCIAEATAFVTYNRGDEQGGKLLCNDCLLDFTEVVNHRLTAYDGLTIHPASRALVVRPGRTTSNV